MKPPADYTTVEPMSRFVKCQLSDLYTGFVQEMASKHPMAVITIKVWFYIRANFVSAGRLHEQV